MWVSEHHPWILSTPYFFSQLRMLEEIIPAAISENSSCEQLHVFKGKPHRNFIVPV